VVVFIIDSIATIKGTTLTEDTKVLVGLVANEEFLSLSSRRSRGIDGKYGSSVLPEKCECLNRSTAELSGLGEINVNVLSETRRVVIADRASVTKKFKDGIGLQDLLFNGETSIRIGIGSSSRWCWKDDQWKLGFDPLIYGRSLGGQDSQCRVVVDN
jgi:hypothetical protein